MVADSGCDSTPMDTGSSSCEAIEFVAGKKLLRPYQLFKSHPLAVCLIAYLIRMVENLNHGH